MSSLPPPTPEPDRIAEKYRRLCESFLHPFVSVTPDSRVTAKNHRFVLFCRALKLSCKQTKLVSCICEREQPLFLRFLDSAVRNPEVPQQSIFEFTPANVDRGVKVVVRGMVVDSTPGEEEIALLMHNVTEQLALEEEQRVARKRLYRSARLATIGTFATGVAHEMNNPLCAVLGFSSALAARMLKGETIERSELETQLQIIHKEALRCRDIVGNLQRFAREDDTIVVSGVSLIECIAGALRLVEAKAARSGIVMTNDLTDDITVEANSTLVEQVIVTLLTNCIDFCTTGNTVRIVAVPQKTDPTHATIAVCDNGPGMAPEVLAKAFDPFFTTKEAGKGAGIGLAFCHRIMEELDGGIDITSEPGKGTAVFLTLPRRRGGKPEDEDA